MYSSGLKYSGINDNNNENNNNNNNNRWDVYNWWDYGE